MPATLPPLRPEPLGHHPRLSFHTYCKDGEEGGDQEADMMSRKSDQVTGSHCVLVMKVTALSRRHGGCSSSSSRSRSSGGARSSDFRQERRQGLSSNSSISSHSDSHLSTKGHTHHTLSPTTAADAACATAHEDPCPEPQLIPSPFVPSISMTSSSWI